MMKMKGLAIHSTGLAANQEFQSSLIRLVIWTYGTAYIALAAETHYYPVNYAYFLGVFGVFIVALLGIMVSILIRPVWSARRYFSISLDIVVISLAITITGEAISPFYLLYIWVYVSAGTRYSVRHLVVASVEAVVAYSLVLTALGQWSSHPFEACFFVVILVSLPPYQYALLRRVQWAKDEAERAKEEAERANKAKGDFLAFMTHELRTPLTGVIGMTELLKTTSLDAEQRDYVIAISNSANVLSALIGDILDFSKIDAAKLKLEHLPFSPRAVVREVCGVLESLALANGVELICEVTPEVPQTITGDQLRARQILFNLVGNAVKFTEEGEVRLRVSTSPPAEGIDEPHLLLEVQDTGVGIPADKIAHIFESFRQADDSTTRRFGGSGLGTTIALELARLMGGTIGVESEEGRGSRFWVRMPLPGTELIPAPIPAPASASRLHGRRALILESNHRQRDLACEALRGAGVTCRALTDPTEIRALGIAAADLDFLVIADRPQGRDLAAIRAGVNTILAGGPAAPRDDKGDDKGDDQGDGHGDAAADRDLPCLFLTYAARRPERRGARSHCLGKPFLAEDLVTAVEQLLGLVPGAPACEPRPQGFAGSDAAAVAGIRVLVAEDNEIAAKVITTFLTKMGIAFRRVDDGEQALREALAGDYGIAIVDLRMPKLDGIAFTRRYRALASGRPLPIVALTANASEEVKQNCLEAGMVDFLAKPVSPELLRQTIERLAVRR